MNKEIQPRLGKRATIAGSVALALAAIAAACSGGGKAEVQATPAVTPTASTPEATVRPRPSPEATAGRATPTPTATPKLETPTPTPTSSPTPESTPTPKPEVKIPLEAQQFIDGVNSLTSLKPEERAAVIKGFVERDLPKAATAPASDEFRKSEPYTNLYSSLKAGYNASKDPAALAEMKKIEQFIAQNWPNFYQELVNEGKFFLK